MNNPGFGGPPPSPYGGGAPPMHHGGGGSNGMATTAAVTGGIGLGSMVFCCPALSIFGMGFIALGLSFLLGIVACVTGFMGMKAADSMGGTGKGAAVAGLVMGVCNVLFGLLFIVLIVLLGAAYFAALVGASA